MQIRKSWDYLNFDPFSAGIVSIHQNLTSVDVRFWRIKTVPALKELKYLYLQYTHNIGIQMKRKELTKPFMMISNWKKHFGCDVFLQINLALQGLIHIFTCTWAKSTYQHEDIGDVEEDEGGPCSAGDGTGVPELLHLSLEHPGDSWRFFLH